MKTILSTSKQIVMSLLIAGALIGCSKEQVVRPSKLVLASETSDFGGTKTQWKYDYDASGNLSKITNSNANGDILSTLEFGYNNITDNTLNLSNRTTYDADISRSLPSKAEVYKYEYGVPVGVYYAYSFAYDNSSRLTMISEKTDRIQNDTEWALNINYDNNNNVSQMMFVASGKTATDDVPFTNQANVPIIVSNYDSHPTPYASLQNWKFLMFSSSIKNVDPEPVLTALSSNNPLDYTFRSDNAFSERTMTYTYDGNGLPATRVNVTKNELGQSAFTQTFTYALVPVSAGAGE